MAMSGPAPRPKGRHEDLETIDVRAARPVPLTASQEAEIRELYHKRVRDKCADEVREFAHCCTGRTFSMIWACRPQRKAMETCMIGHATLAEQDAAREDWFQRVGERKKELDKQEEWRESQRKLKADWWKDYEGGRWEQRIEERKKQEEKGELGTVKGV